MSAEVAPRRGFLRRLAGLAGFSARSVICERTQTGTHASGDYPIPSLLTRAVRITVL